jgi:protein NrfD
MTSSELIEYTTTRANPEVDPHLHVWGWEIPVYLFIGGLIAGLMILSGYHMLRAQWDKERDHGHYVAAPLLCLVLLTFGMIALFLDLSHQLYVWRLYLAFEVTSPMSWGAWILLFVYPLLFGSFVVALPDTMPKLITQVPGLDKIVAFFRKSGLLHFIGFGNVVFGVMLGIYTGILLSALGARPLWNSALLGPLFLFSGLSTGAAVLHILSHFGEGKERQSGFSDAIFSAMVHWIRPRSDSSIASQKLTHADNSFLTVELSIIILFLIGLLTSTQVHQEAVKLLLTGPYAAAFWVFVVFMGILLPLGLQFLQAMNQIRHSILPALLVLLGGLIMRFIFVSAGQMSSWSVALFQ